MGSVLMKLLIARKFDYNFKSASNLSVILFPPPQLLFGGITTCLKKLSCLDCLAAKELTPLIEPRTYDLIPLSFLAPEIAYASESGPLIRFWFVPLDVAIGVCPRIPYLMLRLFFYFFMSFYLIIYLFVCFTHSLFCFLSLCNCKCMLVFGNLKVF